MADTEQHWAKPIRRKLILMSVLGMAGWVLVLFNLPKQCESCAWFAFAAAIVWLVMIAHVGAKHRINFGLLSQPYDAIPREVGSDEWKKWRDEPWQRYVWRTGQVVVVIGSMAAIVVLLWPSRG